MQAVYTLFFPLPLLKIRPGYTARQWLATSSSSTATSGLDKHNLRIIAGIIGAFEGIILAHCGIE